MSTPLPSRPQFKVVGTSVDFREAKNLPALGLDPGIGQNAADSVLQFPGTPNAGNQPADRRLTSWKDISKYLNRGVRTVQRWERRLGLPVHRIGTGKRAPVFAFQYEIDCWLRNERSQFTGGLQPRPFQN